MPNTKRTRSYSVPATFRYSNHSYHSYHPYHSSHSNHSNHLVFEYLPLQETLHQETETWCYEQKALYKLFPDAVPPFLHSLDDQPAVCCIKKDGELVISMEQIWYNKGVIHRSGDKPAKVKESPTILQQSFYDNGQIHRSEDQPALILVSHSPGNMYQTQTVKYPQKIIHQYYCKNILHRWNGPAFCHYLFNAHTEILEHDQRFALFGKTYLTFNEFQNAKSEWMVQQTQNFSLFCDLFVPWLEHTLKHKRKQPNYMVPYEIICKIREFVYMV